MKFDEPLNMYNLLVYMIMGVCVPRPSALGRYPWPQPLSLALYPRPLGPRPPKYCKNKFTNKAYYLFKSILIQG